MWKRLEIQAGQVQGERSYVEVLETQAGKQQTEALGKCLETQAGEVQEKRSHKEVSSDIAIPSVAW